jgi:hypothetical protein
MVENKTFEPEIIDEENDDFFASKDSISIGNIVQMHILRLSSKILDGKVDAQDNKTTGFIDNRREIFFDGVMFLRALVFPYYDKEMNIAEDKYQKELENIQNDFYNTCLDKEAYKRAALDKINPQGAYEYWKQTLAESKFGYFDKTTSEYDYYVYQKFTLSLKLFTAISELMNRTDYLREQDYTE